MLTFKAGMIESVPLAFKASEMSAAPSVPHYTSTVSQIWTGSWIRMDPSYDLSAHSMFTLEKKITVILFLRDMKPKKPEM